MGFVKSYIQLFAYSSVTTEEWKNYLFTYFKDKVRNTWMLSWVGFKARLWQREDGYTLTLSSQIWSDRHWVDI